eukprot:974486_1
MCHSPNCYPSYCDDAILVYHDDASHGGHNLPYIPYIIEGKTVGATLFNVNAVPSAIHGYDESICYNLTTNTSYTTINNSIPMLLTNLSHCDYLDVILEFQERGARAIILIVDIQYNHSNTSVHQWTTRDPRLISYDHWLPFDCIIRFEPFVTNYSAAFESVEPQLNQQMQRMFQTNIRSQSVNYGSNALMYHFDANTTFNAVYASDLFTMHFVENYLRYDLSLDVTNVSCIHGDEFIESYAPTTNPTMAPTISPTSYKTQLWEAVYLPIQVVTSSDALPLLNASDMYVGFLCDTDAPTTAPTNSPTSYPSLNPTTIAPISVPTRAPTQMPTINNPNNDEVVLFAYSDNNSVQFSMAVSFPVLSLTQFLRTYISLCQFSLDD